MDGSAADLKSFSDWFTFRASASMPAPSPLMLLPSRRKGVHVPLSTVACPPGMHDIYPAITTYKIQQLTLNSAVTGSPLEHLPACQHLCQLFHYHQDCKADEIATNYVHYNLQVAELASLAQLLPPRSPTVRNPAPDNSLCRAAPQLRPLQLLLPGPIAASASTAAPRLPPLPWSSFCSPDYVRFYCWSPIALADSSPCRGPMNVLEHSPRSSRFSK